MQFISIPKPVKVAAITCVAAALNRYDRAERWAKTATWKTLVFGLPLGGILGSVVAHTLHLIGVL